jgi:hypothetical protein
LTPEHVSGLAIADLPDGRDSRRCRELRGILGLRYDPDAPAFVRPSGEGLAANELNRWLRTARLVRISLEVNGGICRSLLRVHRGVSVEDPEEREEEVVKG